MTESIDKSFSSETEKNLEIHPASTVYVLSDEENPRALLLKHKKLKVWLPPGGHQEHNESAYDAAIHEVLQETGIDITDHLNKPERIDDRSVSIPVPNYLLLEDIPAHGDNPAHIHQDSIYVVKIPVQDVVRAERESDDIRWFTRQEMEDLEMFANARKLLREIFDSFDKS